MTRETMSLESLKKLTEFFRIFFYMQVDEVKKCIMESYKINSIRIRIIENFSESIFGNAIHHSKGNPPIGK